jgi:oxygen-dependent protoporphyrinogen oxidase
VIIVVGAGITGLAAAFELSKRGIEFVLLESSDRAGGLILTQQVDGFTIEAGPDSFLVEKPAAITLCEELRITSRLIATTPPRRAYVFAAAVVNGFHSRPPFSEMKKAYSVPA